MKRRDSLWEKVEEKQRRKSKKSDQNGNDRKIKCKEKSNELKENDSKDSLNETVIEGTIVPSMNAMLQNMGNPSLNFETLGSVTTSDVEISCDDEAMEQR